MVMIAHFVIIALILGLYLYIFLLNKNEKYQPPWDTPKQGVTQQMVDDSYERCLSTLEDPTSIMTCCEGVQRKYGMEASQCGML